MEKYIVVFGGASLDCIYKETERGYLDEPTELLLAEKGHIKL